ncbi:MAG: hypothetical protein GY814_02205 [Gammaproteobacteria bacterium]|nr:hypothetical protein [Gammaproteobacteria bacterium]
MNNHENSWLAWQKVVLAKLEDLDTHQHGLRDQMQDINDILVETVGRSGKNGRLGMLTERVEQQGKHLIAVEKQVTNTANTRRGILVAGGALGGGSLAAIVEIVRLIVG